MKLQFDAEQAFQLDAIASTVDLFDGSVPMTTDLNGDLAEAFSVIPNGVLPFEDELLRNVQAVQIRNGLPADDILKLITEPVGLTGDTEEWSFPNFSLEMETGTGKTYIYLRTALELRRRYGFTKFIIVVPSIAISEGVMTTLRVTQEHFSALYPEVRYRYQAYDSKSPDMMKQFARNPCVEFLVMTLDSFNKSTNVIYREADRLQGDTAISLLRSTRPILILDEPQRMASELATRSLAGLMPLCALRYSATHRESYNLVYRLTPVDAYRSGIVKQIEVAGVESDVDANRPFIGFTAISLNRKRYCAQLAVHVLQRNGGVREREFRLCAGSDLAGLTGRPEYSGYIVDEVNPVSNTVRFANNVEMSVGETRGDDRAVLFESQIRYTIREHMLRQERLRTRDIKVLSLFFVDRVANYAGDDPIIRNIFDRVFDELKLQFASWRSLNAPEVRAAYFASKVRRGGREELLDTAPSASAEADKKAFELIMKDKERLLSFTEPVAFIFSHSALREGWDNPNVCQICTLNQSISEMRKRQEIGRGMRLVVNQSGTRINTPECNILTVVANESYESYVIRYQQEIAEDFGGTETGAVPENARSRRQLRFRRAIAESSPFRALWDRIRHMTRYSVRVDTEALLSAVVPLIDQLNVRPVSIRVSKGRIVAQGKEFGYEVLAGPKTIDRIEAKGTIERLIETTLHLLEHGTPPFRLTRRTLLELFIRTKTKKAALANPHEWATAAARILRQHLEDQFVQNIKYEVNGETYSLDAFPELVDSWEDRVVPSEYGLYDHVVCDSTPERQFVRSLEHDSRTAAYVKLPRWYRVGTPVGAYNPDWAVARFESDEHGRRFGQLYFVAETKGTLSKQDLRPLEVRKILCGKAHFGTLGIPFIVVKELADVDLDESRGDLS